MIRLITFVKTVAAAEQPSGIGALGLDVKYFLFQLIAFVIVLLVLRKWVFPRLVATLEERRQTVEQSLEHAKRTEEAMHKAEKQIAAMLHQARGQAEDVIGASHKQASSLIEAAEAKAAQRAEHIVHEAKAHMQTELQAARVALKKETAQLVAHATEYILKEKVDAAKNAQLISAALTDANREAK